jgi:hypothetical protein
MKYRYEDIRTFGHKDIGTFRLIEVRFYYRLNILMSYLTLGHKDIRTFGHKDIGTFGR